MKYIIIYAISLLMSAASLAGQSNVDHNPLLMDHGYGHLMDMDGGMVMGENKDRLPAGCEKISEEKLFTVRAGRQYAKKYSGTIFGFDQHEWRVKPCSRVSVEFINEDKVRHQWMLHGLPKNLYNQGMFHLEITGPAKITGSFIAPSDDKTYLVHCDIAQHMEKGMKGQLVVGKGSLTFSSIPGISDPLIADNYAGKAAQAVELTASHTQQELGFVRVLSGAFLGLVLTPILIWIYRKYATLENIKWGATKLLELAAWAGRRMMRVMNGAAKNQDYPG